MKTSFGAVLTALTVIAILAWSIDYGDLVGDRVLRVAEIIRWVCIFGTYAMGIFALMNGKKVQRGLFFYALLVVGAIVPSVISASDQAQPLIAATRLLSFIPIALLAMGLSESGRSRLFIATFASLGFLVLGSLPMLQPNDALANLKTITGDADRTRFSGLTTHPNNLAFFATCAYVYCLAIVFSMHKTNFWAWKFCMAAAGGVLASIACFATGSRTGIACVVSFPLVLIVLSCPLGRPASRARRLAVVLAAAALISTPLFMTAAGLGEEGGGSRSYDVSNHSRFVAWRASLDEFMESPFTGVGAGVGVELTGALESRLSYSHNVLLTWLRNSGLFAGVLAFATILLLTRKAAATLEVMDRRRPGYVPTVAAALSLFAIVAFSAVDGALQGNYLFYLLTPLLYSFVAVEAGRNERAKSESR